ncbi:MAG: hypothetical protein A4E66_00488 [Syntrophus sp. PtaB.Bin001]|nr:MAG: hypothetical protein A4E66_00488 [Syntrophus sp. PtaB.Bin001]
MRRNVIQGTNDKDMAVHIQKVKSGTDTAGMNEIRVGLHDPFGQPRGAAGVHEHGDFIFKDFYNQFSW